MSVEPATTIFESTWLTLIFIISLKLMFNPLIVTLKPQSNEPSYSNTVIGTLAVDGWAVTFGTAMRGLAGATARPGHSSLYQNVTAHPSTASVPTSYYSMWQYIYIYIYIYI